MDRDDALCKGCTGGVKENIVAISRLSLAGQENSTTGLTFFFTFAMYLLC
jgi:hypothetical protein